MKPNSSWAVSIGLAKGLDGMDGRNGLNRTHCAGYRFWFTNLERLSNSRYGDLMLARELGASVLFEEERLAGLEGERGNSRPGAGLQRLRAEAGDIEAEVVLFLGDLHGHGATSLAGQLAAPGQAFVGAFKAFDRQDGAVLHQDGLPDFQAGDLFRDAETKLHVGLLRL